jgi:competence protein ComEC
MINRPSDVSRFYFLIIYLLLFALAAFRVAFYKADVLPKNVNLKFEAVVANIKSTDTGQVLSFANITVFAPKYPEYKEGDRLVISGFVDSDGKLFKPQIEFIGASSNLLTFTSGLRREVLSKIRTLLPEREATLVAGEVLGASDIPSEFKAELTKTGTIHVVVVSGQNLMIVAGVFMAFSRYIGRRKSLVLSVFAIFLYALLAGFQPPVVRAMIMVLVATLALFAGRQVSVLLAIFLAAVLIVIFSPSSLFTISFQLTFAATLGIVTLGQVLQKKFRRIPFLGENAAIALSSFVFTAPVILYYFGRISLLAPIANILVAEAVFPIMILGFFLSVTSIVFSPLAALFALITYAPAHYFSLVVAFFAKIDFGYFEPFGHNLNLLIFLYVLIFLMIGVWKGKEVK